MSLRCLMLCWEYPPIVEGGLGRHVGMLAPALASAGVEVHVLTRGAPGLADAAADADADADGKPDGVSVHRVVEPRRPDDIRRLVGWVERMNDDMHAAGVRLAGRFDFDLVHGHDWLVVRAGEPLAGRLGCPLLMTIHATEHGRHGGWVEAEPQAQIHELERQAVHSADRLITCSQYMRGHLADVFGADERRINVIPNGVELPSSDARLEIRVDPDSPRELVVLLAGRLVHEKGFQLALEAMPTLLDRLGPLRLLIAGTGIHEGALRAKVEELGLGGHVSFLGWISQRVLRGLYAAADVCLVPSIYEPFGLVALEAMAGGCPCVVSDTGGLREVVPHGVVGLRFTVRDCGSLAAMLERILRDHQLRERMVAASRDHVASFGWASVAARTAAVYSELCPAPRQVALGSGQ